MQRLSKCNLFSNRLTSVQRVWFTTKNSATNETTIPKSKAEKGKGKKGTKVTVVDDEVDDIFATNDDKTRSDKPYNEDKFTPQRTRLHFVFNNSERGKEFYERFKTRLGLFISKNFPLGPFEQTIFSNDLQSFRHLTDQFLQHRIDPKTAKK